jgi:hypothetical protein
MLCDGGKRRGVLDADEGDWEAVHRAVLCVEILEFGTTCRVFKFKKLEDGTGYVEKRF